MSGHTRTGLSTTRFVTPRGAPGVWVTSAKQEGPPGSGLTVKFYVSPRQGECADIEETVDGVQRRLCRLQGEHAHIRALDWMEGFAAGMVHSKLPKIVQQATMRRKSLKNGRV